MPDPTPIVPTLRSQSFCEVAGPAGNNRWQAVLDEGMSFSDCLRPEFWKLSVDKITGHNRLKGIGDIIEVRSFDRADYMAYLIKGIGPGYVRLKPIEGTKPEVVELPAACPLVPKWNVGKQGYDVIRLDNKAVISSGHNTKVEAAEWIIKHMQAMAA